MDLFVVNRYVGEESKGCKDSDEKAKFAVLLSKIEERKRRREATVQKSENREDEINGDVKNKTVIIKSEPEVVTRKKKRKKQKQVINSDEDEENIKEDEKQRSEARANDFTILGADKFRKKEKVKRILPYWLANPSVISVNLQQLSTTVKDIPGLDKALIRALKRNNVTHFFPVQTQVIPWLLAAHSKPRQYWPHDICVSAPTGSGKTLAFVIPIVQALCHRLVVQVRALVVLPVQDLAVQVSKVFLTYTAHTDLKVALITGNTSFQDEQKQLVSNSIVSGYRSLVDIVVTTPGRLVDHLHSTPGFSLKHLRFLVIDEADRVIENVQNDWLHHVYSHISETGQQAPPLTISTLESTANPPPQKLLFSATLTQDPEKLQLLGLFQPKLFTSVVGENERGSGIEESTKGEFVGKYTTPAELTEYTCVTTAELKPLVLYHLVASNSWKHVLVFVGSRKDADRLSVLLNHLSQGSLKVGKISAKLLRPAREKILAKFAAGELDIIVSTDALSRGMDIEGVDFVIQYSAPKSVKNYIHRVGRTGRAGRPGTAVTLLLEKQIGHFNEMLSVADKNSVQELKVEEEELEHFEEAYKSALQQLKSHLEKQAIQQAKLERRKKKLDRLIQKKTGRKQRRKLKKGKQMANGT